MKRPNIRQKLLAGAGATALLAAAPLLAGDYGKAVIDDKMPAKPPVEPWTFCDVFDMNTLYERDSGFVRDVELIGRYQGQHISQQEEVYNPFTNTNTLDGFHQYQVRRFRVGLDIAFANNLSLKANFNITDASGSNSAVFEEETFNDFDEFVLEWEPEYHDDPKAPVNRGFRLTSIAIGKHKQKITRENATSSKRILTIERSHIVNEVISDKPWGISIGYEFAGIEQQIGGWIYGAEDAHPLGYNRLAFPDGDSRGGLTYRASTGLTEATDLFFDYQFTNNSDGLRDPAGHADTSLASAYEHVVAVGSESDFGRLQLTTDLIFAANRERRTGNLAGAGGLDTIPAGNDTWGFVFLPTYDITDKLQAVCKYAYMDEGRQQRTQRFSGARHTLQSYHTVYAGLNYYICEHNLKLMAGYEYATGEIFGVSGSDIDSSTWMVGLRTYF